MNKLIHIPITILACIGVFVFGYVVHVNVNPPKDYKECHDNLTCDGSKSCHQMDGEYICIGKVQNVDPRRNSCFTVIEEDVCFKTLPKCMSMRADFGERFPSAGFCTTRPMESKPGPVRN